MLTWWEGFIVGSLHYFFPILATVLQHRYAYPYFLPEEAELDQLSYLPKDTQLASGRTRSQNSVWLQSPHFPLYHSNKDKKAVTVAVSLISSCPPLPSPSPQIAMWVTLSLPCFLSPLGEGIKATEKWSKEFSRKKKEVKQRAEYVAPECQL